MRDDESMSSLTRWFSYNSILEVFSDASGAPGSSNDLSPTCDFLAFVVQKRIRACKADIRVMPTVPGICVPQLRHRSLPATTEPFYLHPDIRNQGYHQVFGDQKASSGQGDRRWMEGLV
jgi:hypothetical protein